jgi:hypothetical protein
MGKQCNDITIYKAQKAVAGGVLRVPNKTFLLLCARSGGEIPQIGPFQ